MLDPKIRERLRALPPVHELVRHPWLDEVRRTYSAERVTEAVQDRLNGIRESLLSGTDSRLPYEDMDGFAGELHRELRRRYDYSIRTVLNATGIVLHTNLGRAPIANWGAFGHSPAAEYVNLEIDLETGLRSNRQTPIREALVKLTGCESATVVNNCAAATVITLRALAKDREVIVSRGELVEIGGSYRIPEILEASGAVLREVGTTNITRTGDYAKAITPRTALIMRVHQSNYRIRGFTAAPALADLVALAKAHSIPFVDDIGGGAIVPLEPYGLKDEPLVGVSVKAEADLVLFSGDKLLGGPQSGLIIGKKEYVERIEKDPLMRAFRCDKLTLAALEATLCSYLTAGGIEKAIPIYAMLAYTPAQLRDRCGKLAEAWASLAEFVDLEILDEVAYVGGGTLPDQALPTVVIAAKPKAISAEEFATALRRAGVLTRIKADRVLFDLRTIAPGSEDRLTRTVEGVLKDSRTRPR